MRAMERNERLDERSEELAMSEAKSWR